MRLVHCVKLNKEAEGLPDAPYPGDLGKKIYEHISKEAWALWLKHQTMLINEYHLKLMDPKARAFLAEEMQQFFFGKGSAAPQGFTPIE